ncbi:DUF1398 family protein [Bdellovibrio sp. HCB209]|uniref:DUF1398 family protein n=1 Tax=Bdellovibrio sp. HCB209 TaxID=3394354 RepID=UPI0039B5A27E
MDPHESGFSEEAIQAGAMKFSEFIASLEIMDVEYCRVDLLENRITFSIQNGEVLEDHLELSHNTVSDKFDDGGIRAAIMENQQKELGFLEFVSKLMDSGVVSYTVYPIGKKTIYVGRHGDSYYENIKSIPDGVRHQGPETSTVQ